MKGYYIPGGYFPIKVTGVPVGKFANTSKRYPNVFYGRAPKSFSPPRGTNSTTTNYITGTANANRIYFKKYSDTCLPLWWNESIGRKIIKEFCKKVHWQTLAAVILGFSTLSFINPQI